MITENNVAAQAGDEPMRAAFFEWFAEFGGPYGSVKDAQDVFTAGYRAAMKSSEPVGRVVLFSGDSDLKEVSWHRGKIPQVGTRLYTSPRATADVERVTITPALRRAVDMTRADLGESGSNYPAVRELLAFAESHIATTKPGA